MSVVASLFNLLQVCYFAQKISVVSNTQILLYCNESISSKDNTKIFCATTAEAYSEYCRTSKMERFAKIVKSYFRKIHRLRCLTGTGNIRSAKRFNEPRGLST